MVRRTADRDDRQDLATEGAKMQQVRRIRQREGGCECRQIQLQPAELAVRGTAEKNVAQIGFHGGCRQVEVCDPSPCVCISAVLEKVSAGIEQSIFRSGRRHAKTNAERWP